MTTISKNEHINSHPEHLNGHHQHHSTLTENGNDLLIFLNVKGIIIYANPTITTILHYLPQELIGSPRDNLAHPDDLATIQQVYQAEEGVSLPVAYRLRDKNGAWH